MTQWSPMGSWVSMSDVARGLFFYFEDVVFRYKYILFEFVSLHTPLPSMTGL